MPHDPHKTRAATIKRWMAWLLALLVLAGLGLAVARTLKARQAQRSEAVAQVRAPAVIELSAGDVVAAARVELHRSIQVSGGLKAVNSAVVKAQVAAELRSLSVREGDSVTAGQVIGQLDTAELELRLRQAEQTAASTRAQLDIARRTLENNRALVAQGFISATGLETSVSNEAAAAATYGAAAAAAGLARKSLGDARLVSPISGRVSQRLVQPGERVGVDTRLVEVVDLSRIELEAAVPPEEVGSVRVGQPARLEVDGLPGTVAAKVARINPSAQAGTRAVMVYLAVEPRPGLRQGLFATGTVEVGRQAVLAVPVSAVRIDQPRPYVLAVEGGQVVPRTVVLGQRGDALLGQAREHVVELKDGLGEGRTVLRGSVGTPRAGTAVRLAAAATTAASAARPAVR
jgi:RND family efflux transporter MFP subunit